MVILSVSVKRFSISCMQDFLLLPLAVVLTGACSRIGPTMTEQVSGEYG